MKKLSMSLALSILTLGAQENLPKPDKRLWKASLTTLAAANLIDVRSSWNQRELNPVLAGPNGRFGRDGIIVKLGLQGGLFGIEYLITRGHPTRKVYRTLTFINFGAAAATGAVAARNFTIAR